MAALRNDIGIATWRSEKKEEEAAALGASLDSERQVLKTQADASLKPVETNCKAVPIRTPSHFRRKCSRLQSK